MKFAGLAFGLIVGLFTFMTGFKGFFTLGSNDDTLGWAACIVYVFSLPPLALLGWFSPRMAGIGAVVSIAVLLSWGIDYKFTRHETDMLIVASEMSLPWIILAVLF